MTEKQYDFLFSSFEKFLRKTNKYLQREQSKEYKKYDYKTINYLDDIQYFNFRIDEILDSLKEAIKK